MAEKLDVKNIFKDSDRYIVEVILAEAEKKLSVKVYFNPGLKPYAGDPFDETNGKALQRKDMPGGNSMYHRIYTLAANKLKEAKLRDQGQLRLL